MIYIARATESVFKKIASEFPVVVLTGPRQSGKTTLLQHLVHDHSPYLSLEPPDVRAAANNDPRAFLALYPAPVIFDEVQYSPDLLFYIKENVDKNRSNPGQYFLSGSQNLLLSEKVTETLAGRAGILTLLPLSLREILQRPDNFFPWEEGASIKKDALDYQTLWEILIRGSFPEIVANPQRDSYLWQANYVQTYLERDVRNLRQVGDLSQFQVFLRALAARSAQLLHISELARDIGVAVNTVKAWLAILEATYQIIIVRPYFANIGKRLVKAPKVYFTDTGLLCYLTGVRDIHQAIQGPMSGTIFETAVVVEVVKLFLNRGLPPPIYFWRTATGMEVDLLVEYQNKLVPIEIKSTATPSAKMAAGILSLREELGKKITDGFVIHAGDTFLPLVPGVLALPLSCL